MPSAIRKNINHDRSEEVLPDLNPGTLQNLAHKIQESFKQPSKARFQAAVTNRRNGISSKGSENHVESSFSVQRPYELHKRTNKTPQTKSALPSGDEPLHGRKRLRDGQIKDSKTNGRSKVSKATSTDLGSRHAQQPISEGNDLEQEVLALGGTADDLELLKDVESDSEIDLDSGLGRKSADKSLKKELLQMVGQLDIEKVGNDELEDTYATDDEKDEQDSGEIRPRQIEDNRNKRQKDVAEGSSRAHVRFEDGASQSSIPLLKPSKGGKAMLLIQPQAEWHSASLPALPQSTEETRRIPLSLSDRLHQHAKTLLEKENANYAVHYGSASTEQKFYSTLMSAGTLSDKISALTLSVQESPLHNMQALESLLNLARKRSRDQAVNVLGALKDLFGPGNLLPSNQRLRNFASQPGLAVAFESNASHSWSTSSPLPGVLREAHLIAFAYEDWLKTVYFEMLQILETWCNDEVIYARGKAVEYIATLLRDKPEQEANLLRLMVNKLGDSDRKIASKASFNVLQLETSHPLMKPTIVAAIESENLFRPKQSLHAQYYAIITLNQTVLSAREETLARKLLDIYFDLFAKLLKRPDGVQQEADAPTTTQSKITVNKKGEIQGGGGHAGKKALKKQKAAEKSTNVEEDLREKMLSAILTGINRAVPYTTTNDDFFDKHMDTLYRITHSANFNTSIQALMLIQQINGVNQGSQDRFYRVLYESLLDQRLLTSSKQALYLNLLFRALRSDLHLNRVKAFVKRLLQVIAMHQPPLVCGVLYLLRELEKTFPALTMLIDRAVEDASDDEETFRDVDDGDEELPIAPKDVTSSIPRKNQYDPRKRDPVHANASDSALWELPAFITHYHPSVSLFAKSLLSHDPMPPKPDLQQNTLISFLDRFVYKNPKLHGNARTKGTSIMQPLSSGDDGNVFLPAASRATSKDQPVNSDAFWRQEDKEVTAHEVFFHKYFRAVKSKEERKRGRKAKRSKAGQDDVGTGSDEEEEAEIWKALVDSRPEIEGDDSNVDMGFSDDEELAAALDGDDSELSGLGDGVLGNGEGIDDTFDDDDATSSSEGDHDEILGTLEGSVEGTNARGKAKDAGMGSVQDRKSKKRKLKGLPTFASADDYAEMLADGSHEDGG